MPTTESPPPPAGDQPSNWSLIARMIGLGWRYRRGCTHVVILHILVVCLSLSALGLTGVCIDLIGHHLAPETVPQKLPRLFTFARGWSALQQLSLIAGLILGFALLTTAVRYLAAIAVASLSQRVLIQLRSDVYDKL